MKRSFYSLFILLSISLFLIISGCKKDDTPTAPQNRLPKIESLTANPTTVLINTETTLTCIATDEDGDNLTITWSSKRGSFSNGVVGISVKWVSPSTAGKDTITATVNDGKQTIQGKLEIIVGTIPASPTLAAPANNATEIALSPTLSWNTVSNAVSYTLQVSSSSTFNSFVFNQSGLTNTSQLISGLNINTTYYWRVNSTNIYGTSGWSNVFSFKTLAPPIAPTLLTPANNANEITLSPVLAWNAVSNAVSYSLQVSTSSSFSSFIYNQNGLINISQQISGLNIAITYYWRVNSTNIYGTSGWSTTFTFKTVGPPQAPTLTAPANNSTEVSLFPTLTWNAVNNAVSYTLQVSTNNSFSSFVYNQNGLTTISQLISSLNIATTYYWRLNATNNYGTSNWSNVFSFITVAPPQAPTLISPLNAAQNISLTPTLSWNVIANATSYTLQVSMTNSFSSFVYNQSGLTGTSQLITGLGNVVTYYWRVNATNSYGTSGWSTPTWSFTTPCGLTIIYAGKTYNTVQIGNQCWLKENLDVGAMILGNQNPSNNGTIEKYCYNNDDANCTTYGGLYQWNEAMQYLTTEKAQGICPTGWHIPTLAEFVTLVTSVGGNGNSLKSVGQGTGSGAGTNTTGFSGLLAGYRDRDISGPFYYLGTETIFWSSTEAGNSIAYRMYLAYNNSNIIYPYTNKDYGFSVRCLKD